MSKQSKKKTRRDVVEVARSIVERIIGEKLNGQPLDKPESPKRDTRNQAAVALSKLGASKGGKARAKSLSSAKRRAIARKAAKARWAKKDI